MENRHRVYNETLAYISAKERAGKLLVIRPEEKLQISKIEKDPQKLKQIYDIGRKTAEARLEQIRMFLG